MTNTRKKQVRTLAILLVAVVGLTIGFAAFTSSLRIKTRLSVNPNKGTFNVKFSKEANSLVEDNVIPQKSSDIFEAFEGVIDNSGIPTISDLGGEFTQPGESITYEFYALNTGEYKAYLTDVIFGNVDGEDTNKVCTSLDGTHQSEVDTACSNINIKVTVGSDILTDILTTTRSNLVGHELNPNASEKVKVEITYSSGGILPEVPFEVTFGDISMVYNSLEASDIAQEPEEEYYDGDFISLESGVLSIYRGNDTNIVIPDTLPVVELAKMTYNQEKCLNMLGEGANCDEVHQQYESGEMSIGEAEIKQACKLAFDCEYRVIDEEYIITEIGDIAFGNMFDSRERAEQLRSVVIPDAVTKIGNFAFYKYNLGSVVLPASLEIVEMDSFGGNYISNLILPSRLKTLEYEAFARNELKTITIPDSVETIGQHAFGENQLTSVVIGSGVTSIGTNSFSSGYLVIHDDVISQTSDLSQYPNATIYWGQNQILDFTIRAPKSQITNWESNVVGWDSSKTCENVGTIDDTCITWENN